MSGLIITRAVSSAVVRRSLHARRRAVIGYGLGLGVMIVWVMAIYPSVETELVDYIEAMPSALKSILGIDEITSLAGFVHAEVLSLMGPVLFLALAITTGASAIAGEEHERILPLLLATGIGRRRLLVSKLTALGLDVAAFGAMTWAAILVGQELAGGGIAVSYTAAAMLQLAALAFLFGTLALAVGAVTGKNATATGVAISIALAAYLLDALASLASWLEPFEVLSPFHWYAPGNPLLDGLSVGGLALLVAATVGLAAWAVVVFDRRDVGT